MKDEHTYPYYEQTKQFIFIFTYKKDASSFTCFEELLKVTDFG